MLDETTLKARLNRPLRYFDSVDSTQDIALGWLRAGAVTGAVVIADEQVRGRGRHGRMWHTPPGVALALSVILKPRVDALSQVTMLGALAIAEAIDIHATPANSVTIKWPNDVRIDGRKVSGVLPEAEWEGGRLIGVALGMGVNVRADFSDTALATIATSIEPALNCIIDRNALAVAIVERVDYWSAWLGSERLFSAWSTRLETIGRRVQINGVAGVAERVECDGGLFVRDNDGILHKMIAGDLSE